MNDIPESQSAPPVRTWSTDDTVVAAFALLGFGGAVFLPLAYNVPPIVTSFLLATGLAALTYRYLGGIGGASFAIGALKLTGTLGAMVGIALLINNQLVYQTTVQVWELHGKVLNQNKDAIDPLNDADFSVFPVNAHAGKLGDFHVEFIRHPTESEDKDMYLTVLHKDFGKVVIPLDETQLKALYPDAKIQGKHISIDHIILPASPDASHVKEGSVVDLTGQQLQDYTAVRQYAKPANPNVGGVLK